MKPKLRWTSCWLVGLLACGGDPAGGEPVAADAAGSLPDQAVAQVDLRTGDDSAAEIPPDATEVTLEDTPRVGDSGDAPASPDADPAAEVAAPADASPTGLPGWLVGTWQDCGGTFTLAADGAWAWQEADSACTLAGKATWDGMLLALTVTGGSCGKTPTWIRPDLGAGLAGGTLALSHPAIFGGVHRLAQGPDVVRERWDLTADTGGKATMSLCFHDGAYYDGGYVSPGCTFLSCGGGIDQVKTVGTAVHLWTHCQGDCPCSTVLIAKTKTEKAMSGSYFTGNCLGTASGGFQAVRVDFPGDPAP